MNEKSGFPEGVPLTYLSLFSGIGGLDLGLDRAGLICVGQVELDEFCRRVLAKHWPEVPRHDDVRSATEWWRAIARPTVDVVVGGFPCQPFSSAGRRRGVADERWGWPWMAAVVSVLRPRYIVVENVTDILGDSAAWGRVLGDLATLGFDAWWDCLPAAAFGANHRRYRVLLVAHAAGEGRKPGGPQTRGKSAPGSALESWPFPTRSTWWSIEPDVGRVAYGVPGRVDRCRGLGNAVVPQLGEYAGRLIVAAETAASDE